MTLTDAGYLGIGTTTPSSMLHIIDESAITSHLVTMQAGSASTPITGAYSGQNLTGYYSGTPIATLSNNSLISRGIGSGGSFVAGSFGLTTNASDSAAGILTANALSLDKTAGGSATTIGTMYYGDFTYDIFKPSFTANSNLTIVNQSVDGSGNGKDIVFSVANGTDGDDNAGNYVFGYATGSGDGLMSRVIYEKSHTATEEDDGSMSVIPWIQTSGWNTDTSAAVDGAFVWSTEGSDGDNNTNVFGEHKLLWVSEDFSLEKSFISFSDEGVNFDLSAEAESGTQEMNGNLISFEANAWNTGNEEGQGVYYSMQAMANAGANTSADLIFLNNNGDEKFRFTDAGYLGIGTSTPSSVLHVVGTSTFAGDVSIASLSSNGVVYSNGTYLTNVEASDERLKTNIESIPDILEKILGLRPVSFDWISNGEASLGFIAQEMEEVMPELVKEGFGGYKGILSDKLVPYLVKAIQEQQVQITNLNSLILSGSLDEFAADQSEKGALVFAGDIEFTGHVAFNEDTVGVATVLAGETEVQIDFVEEYGNEPVVTISLATDVDLDKYFVSDITTSSFAIKIFPTSSVDIKFNWHAFGVIGEEEEESEIVEIDSEVVEEVVVETPVEEPVVEEVVEETVPGEETTEEESETVETNPEVIEEEVIVEEGADEEEVAAETPAEEPLVEEVVEETVPGEESSGEGDVIIETDPEVVVEEVVVEEEVVAETPAEEPVVEEVVEETVPEPAVEEAPVVEESSPVETPSTESTESAPVEAPAESSPEPAESAPSETVPTETSVE